MFDHVNAVVASLSVYVCVNRGTYGCTSMDFIYLSNMEERNATVPIGKGFETHSRLVSFSESGLYTKAAEVEGSCIVV